MAERHPKNVIVIAGVNGAGKTSWVADRLLTTLEISEFVNADEIARGLSPLSPQSSAFAAGRVMIERLHQLVGEGASFALETTLSGRAHALLLKQCRASGYRIMLVYLWLPSAEDAVARVARRVAKGGHHVPADVVVRRYTAGLRNLHRLYLPLADVVVIFDNSDNNEVLIADQRYGRPFIIYDDARWKLMRQVV